jgi:hypothetical protein
MENTTPLPISSTPSTNEGISKNMIIILLLGIILLTFLGINIFNKTGSFLIWLNQLLLPFISQILSFFGYTTGTLVNTTADAATLTTKTSLDILHDTIYDIGNLFKMGSESSINPKLKNKLDKIDIFAPLPTTSSPPPPPDLDQSINNSTVPSPIPSADNTSSPIQNAITSNKMGWCLVGEYQDRRGCIEVSDINKCVSGQIFPDQQTCTNPYVDTPTFLGTTSERGYY